MASRKNFPGNVERKRKDAAERQAAYNKLSNEEKLERLDRANLTASRERYKLTCRITKAAEAETAKLLADADKIGKKADAVMAEIEARRAAKHSDRKARYNK